MEQFPNTESVSPKSMDYLTKVAKKKDASQAEIEAITNLLDLKKRELDEARTFYKENRSNKWKEKFRRTN
ncbi:hypothetical protein EHI8A_168590 [Entamoeba histolytica HM-1:IMSS-B]|uniref:Uncharacterized protein n=6 Tax=Entamoeba TaxID=5758 RepID=B1N2P6_ENTH1|nr:hypothetical protein EHI_183200 [Entamoeba histolytica HM-1:IMSS]XP_008857432.1 hypothetical protein ENU1_097390 [Entamoeba nuttalli P19]EMD46047.1 Hypothetical protein EHI5A_185700 [Entamoeba histolytica KU27]EMH76806.1 hypothetical protein EHI8A_168590 [Entamoeba histolytica HM-1:IMSS-B]EMS14349.1 hypothetical protein KM1_226540 [Entamoeba histolytica HM-3:IMSS]ENY61452.1 hypothetical protein EHI7A_164550 [Entamoeba histolytica HM-1:IMSS-A]EDS89770.1 hypothetical protein EHI_183200 [Enta|eukprot:XP_008857432.1 hypothetical protein ENU1_097390 [Entamoeba nuttalli P19]